MRQGLYVATDRVFAGLVIVAIGGIIVLLLTPRRFAQLRFGDEKEPTPADQSGATETASVRAVADG